MERSSTLVLGALIAVASCMIAGAAVCATALAALVHDGYGGLVRNATLGIGIAAGMACGIVVLSAFLIVYEREARHLPCTIGAAIGEGRRRFWPFVGVQVIVLPASLVLIFGFGALTFGSIAFGRAIVPTSPILGTIVAYVIGIVLIPTGIAGFAVFMTLATVSLSVCAAEGAGAGASLRIAWRRCFSRSQIRRTVAVGMAWIAPLFAIAIALAFFRSALTFGPTIEPILRVVLQIPVFVIGYAWTTVFSLDARIRSEGYDLEIATLAGSPSEIITT